MTILEMRLIFIIGIRYRGEEMNKKIIVFLLVGLWIFSYKGFTSDIFVTENVTLEDISGRYFSFVRNDPEYFEYIHFTEEGEYSTQRLMTPPKHQVTAGYLRDLFDLLLLLRKDKFIYTLEDRGTHSLLEFKSTEEATKYAIFKSTGNLEDSSYPNGYKCMKGDILFCPLNKENSNGCWDKRVWIILRKIPAGPLRPPEMDNN